MYNKHFIKFWNWYYKDKDPITPESPVIPNSFSMRNLANLYKDREIEVAKKQTEYRVLPSIRIYDKQGTIITRWKLDLLQRIILLFTGNLYIHYMTFYKPIQPLYLDLLRPDKVDPNFNKKLNMTRDADLVMKKEIMRTKDFLDEFMQRRFQELWSVEPTGRVNSNSVVDKIT